ncbi:MAG: flagellar hook-basal body complex protein FliE [Thermotogae bacterium]|nr:flagellar hook-basal body complex protein FliE [Thermotogota bacterium]
MVDKINGVNPIQRGVPGIEQTSRKPQTDFKDLLMKAIEEVNQSQKEAEQATIDFATGKISSVHDVILKAEEATMTLRLTTEVRNRIIEAYREIMRMQI